MPETLVEAPVSLCPVSLLYTVGAGVGLQLSNILSPYARRRRKERGAEAVGE